MALAGHAASRDQPGLDTRPAGDLVLYANYSSVVAVIPKIHEDMGKCEKKGAAIAMRGLMIPVVPAVSWPVGAVVKGDKARPVTDKSLKRGGRPTQGSLNAGIDLDGRPEAPLFAAAEFGLALAIAAERKGQHLVYRGAPTSETLSHSRLPAVGASREEVVAALPPGQGPAVARIDVTDAFRNMSINPIDWIHNVQIVGGRVSLSTSADFGQRDIPGNWQRITAAVCSVAKRRLRELREASGRAQSCEQGEEIEVYTCGGGCGDSFNNA